jgi:hypothetical protein
MIERRRGMSSSSISAEYLYPTPVEYMQQPSDPSWPSFPSLTEIISMTAARDCNMDEVDE